MFERALVAMDLSPATEALVSAIPGLREFGTREVILAHVARPIREPVSQSLRQVGDLKERLGGLAERLKKEGFTVTVEVPSGSPAVELCRLAKRKEPDFIMAGSRSHTRMLEAFVGSVAWELVRRAQRPILLHRIEPNRPDPEAALEAHAHGLPRRVVHPTDFSETARRAIPLLQGLVEQGVSELTLLHVLPVEAKDDRDDAMARLKELAAEISRSGDAEITCLVRLGTPYEEILSTGGKDSDSMVVMGTHGRGFLPEIVLGSESRQVVRRASASVFLVPVDAETAGAETPE